MQTAKIQLTSMFVDENCWCLNWEGFGFPSTGLFVIPRENPFSTFFISLYGPCNTEHFTEWLFSIRSLEVKVYIEKSLTLEALTETITLNIGAIVWKVYGQFIQPPETMPVQEISPFECRRFTNLNYIIVCGLLFLK